MIKCFNCGTENGDGLKYCCNCGAMLNVPAINDEEPQEAIEIATAVDEEPIPAEPIAAAPVSAPVSAPVNAPVTQARPQTNQKAPQSGKNDSVCFAGFLTSLISILCCGMTSIVGLGLSIWGYMRVKKSGQKGEGMAIAGMVISGLFVLIFLFSMISGAFDKVTGKSNGDTTITTTTEIEETTEATTKARPTNTPTPEPTEATSESETETEPSETTASETTAGGIRPDVKAAIDSYEQFYNEYCDFLRRYSESNYSATMMTEYMQMYASLAEYEARWDALDVDSFTAEEEAYYEAADERIIQKMLEAESYMVGQMGF